MPKITPLIGLTRETLSELYHERKMGQTKIAEMFGVTQGAIYFRMRSWNIKTRTRQEGIILNRASGAFSGPRNPRWSGGRHTSKSGYVFVRSKGARASYRGYIREHIMVWEAANGPLPEGWHVHHMNGVKDDNRLENLEAMPWKKHRDLIPELMRRISELESENAKLRKSNARKNGLK